MAENVSINTTLISWESVEPTDPYSAAETPRPTVEQQIKAEIAISGDTLPVTVYYSPHNEGWEYWKYVVRARTDAGLKSKDVFAGENGLYLKNRAVPWDEDKEWTYLSMEECKRRAQIAGLGTVTEDTEIDHDNRYRIHLDEHEQPLVDDENNMAEELVLQLAKGLLVLQSADPPTT